MKIVKSAAFVGGLTFISRIFGYFRDMAIAYTLGASILNDIFIIVFRLPNIFRSIFGEGAFSAAFIPIFNKIYQNEGKVSAYNFTSKAQSILIVCLIIFCLLAIIFMPAIIKITAPGYSDMPEVVNLMINLSRITFPYIIFISLMAFYGGVANSLGNYFAFASAPILLNIILLVAAFVGVDKIDKIFSLSYGILIAGIVEMLWVLYFVYKKFGIPKLVWPSLDKNVNLLFKKILPGIFASGINQINIFVSTIIASYVAGGVSYLYYADRIYQLPLAIIGTAFGTVLLPELSKNLAANKSRKSLIIQNHAMITATFITVPLTIGLMVFTELVVEVLFERGAFTHEHTIKTAAALCVFACSLPAYIYNKILSSVFFAHGDTKTPVKIGAFVLIINIIISIKLLPYYEHVAVAIGALIAAWLNIFLQIYILHKNGQYQIYNNTKIKVFKIIVAGGLMGAAVFLCRYYISFTNAISELICLSLVGGVIYISTALILKIYRIKNFFKA